MSIPTNIQAVNPQNIQYLVQIPEKEEKNFIEGIMWGVNGVQNVAGAIAVVGGTVMLDAAAMGLVSVGSSVFCLLQKQWLSL